ncbi:MAG: hypothetical protein KatS3mg097_655 [Candidatus Parcubacteria bacterium]|nr:MAG: hypothetical protein KatS3mg097_655 [Candidatus Parcubacteria bacterium]
MNPETYKPSQENQPIDSRKLSEKNTEKWIEVAQERLEEISLPEDLIKIIKESLNIPQLGPYHNEGPIMAAHLGLMVQSLEEIKEKSFNFSILKIPSNEILRNHIINILTTTAKKSFEQLLLFIYLHDIGKSNCMVIIDNQKRQIPFNMGKWQEYLQQVKGNRYAALKKLKTEGYEQISYRTDDKDHGEEGVRIIQELARTNEKLYNFIEENNQLLSIISNHEAYFQVFSQSSSAKNFEKLLRLLNLIDDNGNIVNEENLNLFFTACFLGIAGSLNKKGESDFNGFINMVVAWECYKLIDKFLRELEVDENKKQHIKERLINLSSIEDVNKKIQEIKNEEKLKTVKFNDEDIEEIIQQAITNKIIKLEDKERLREIMTRSNASENIFAFLGQNLPKEWKRLIPQIREFLLKKI